MALSAGADASPNLLNAHGNDHDVQATASTLSRSQHTVVQPPALPKTTTSQSDEYCRRLGSVCGRAFLNDPLSRVLTLEHATSEAKTDMTMLQNIVAERFYARATEKCALGGHVVEAADFAAVAVWSPPGVSSGGGQSMTDEQMEELRRERPEYAKFLTAIRDGKERTFGDGGYWNVSCLARDPGRSRVPAAVRAVLEPYVKKAKHEGASLWADAGNETSRNLFLYLGFEVVEVIKTFVGTHDANGMPQIGGKGVPTWLMCCKPART